MDKEIKKIYFRGMATEDLVAAMLTQAYMNHPGLPALVITGGAGGYEEETFSKFQQFREKIKALIEAEIAAAKKEEG